MGQIIFNTPITGSGHVDAPIPPPSSTTEMNPHAPSRSHPAAERQADEEGPAPTLSAAAPPSMRTKTCAMMLDAIKAQATSTPPCLPSPSLFPMLLCLTSSPEILVPPPIRRDQEGCQKNFNRGLISDESATARRLRSGRPRHGGVSEAPERQPERRTTSATPSI